MLPPFRFLVGRHYFVHQLPVPTETARRHFGSSIGRCHFVRRTVCAYGIGKSVNFSNERSHFMQRAADLLIVAVVTLYGHYFMNHNVIS